MTAKPTLAIAILLGLTLHVGCARPTTAGAAPGPATGAAEPRASSDPLPPRRISGASPYIGVSLDQRDGGLFIVDVLPGTAAERDGLRPGDEIRDFAGEPIAVRDDLREMMSRCAAGDTVAIVVRRDGRETIVQVTLDARDPGDER